MIEDILFFYHEIVCCVYSLELPHRGDFNDYTQYSIIFWKIEKLILKLSYLPPDLALRFTISGLSYPHFEQISIVPKSFKLLDSTVISNSKKGYWDNNRVI